MPTRRMCRTLLATGLIVLGFDASAVFSQSLGDVARREADRRREAQTAGRVFTNDDLGAVEPSTAAPQPPALATEAPEPAAEPPNAAGARGATVIEEIPGTGTANIRTAAPAREKRDEQYWRARAQELRARVERVGADLAAAQANLAALERAPGSASSARERQVVASAVERLQSELRYRQQDILKLQMQAEMNKVPPAWVQ